MIKISKHWGSETNMMYVIGVTRSKQLSEVRKIIPNHFLLSSGVGTQGGNLEDVAKYGMNKDCGLLVNSSRGVIYSDDGINFKENLGKHATQLQNKMDILLKERGI